MRRVLPVLLLWASACSGHVVDLSSQAPATLPQEPPGFERATVTRVVDGDTIEALVEGEAVTLVKDVEETDSYGRLLRYVYVGQEMVDARLVANGYAHA